MILRIPAAFRNALPSTTAAALIFAFALATTAAPRAFALAQVARGQLTLQTTAIGTYDSYFVGTATNDPDYYFSVQPLLLFQRNAGLASIGADAGVTLTQYLDNTQYNASDITAGLRINLPVQPGSRLDGNASLNYIESTDVNFGLNDRIPTNTLSANLHFNYNIGTKHTIIESFHYSDRDRDTDLYSDQTIWANTLSYRYSDFFHGSSLALNYGYTDTSSSGNNYLGVPIDQQDNSISLTYSRPIYGEIKGSFSYGYHILHRGANETSSHDTRSSSTFFTIGIDGPFLPPSRFPKITSSASIMYRESGSQGINYHANRTLTGYLAIAWQARARTRLAFNASRDEDLNAADFSVSNSHVSFSVVETIGMATTLSANVSYNWSEFHGITRKDDYLSAALSLGHTINEHWSASVSYQFQDNNNTSSGPQPTPYAGRDYTRHVVALSIVNKF